jgi:L-rhamnose mutarotase
MTEGIPTLRYPFATKRYVQCLELRDDAGLIARYRERHRTIWPEVVAGIRSVGILDMELFLEGTRLVMLVETAADFEWESAFKKLASLPRQAEWEASMAAFQLADPSASSSEKWRMMERIFALSDIR